MLIDIVADVKKAFCVLGGLGAQRAHGGGLGDGVSSKKSQQLDERAIKKHIVKGPGAGVFLFHEGEEFAGLSVQIRLSLRRDGGYRRQQSEHGLQVGDLS